MFESGFDFDWNEEVVALAAVKCKRPSGVQARGKMAERSASTIPKKGDGGGPEIPTVSEKGVSKHRDQDSSRRKEVAYFVFEDFAPSVPDAYEAKVIPPATAAKVARQAKEAYDMWPTGVGAAGYSGASFDETGKIEAVPVEGVWLGGAPLISLSRRATRKAGWATVSTSRGGATLSRS